MPFEDRTPNLFVAVDWGLGIVQAPGLWEVADWLLKITVVDGVRWQRSDWNVIVSVQILVSNFISGRNLIYIQSGEFPPTFKSYAAGMIRKLEKSERRKGERNSFLAYSFPAAQTVRSGEANIQLLIITFW